MQLLCAIIWSKQLLHFVHEASAQDKMTLLMDFLYWGIEKSFSIKGYNTCINFSKTAYFAYCNTQKLS